MRRQTIMLTGLVAAVLATGSVAQTEGAQASGCRAEPGTFSLRVDKTSCAVGRSMTRAYQKAECYGSRPCIVTARDERWSCRYRIIRDSGVAPYNDGGTVKRGQARCYRIRDQAIATWRYTGAGD